MIISRIRLPFTLSEVYGGFAEANGLMYVQGDQLLVEVMVKDAIFGVVKSKPKRIAIPFRDIISIDYKRNMFVSRMLLRVGNITYLSEIPGDNKGEIKFKIRRKDKEMAQNLVSHINLRISEIRLDELDEEF
ncbi:MAG: hypothetical protein D6730_19080 [Bacteroidetes bacterium]|nr:MAG: hypothetical protein D6730_19080 [Bacteroidota bacterium]